MLGCTFVQNLLIIITMKKHFLILTFSMLLIAVSCGNRQGQTQCTYTRPLAPWEQTVGNDTIMFSSQELTSWDRMFEAFDNGVEGDCLHEPTPASAAFFEREKDVEDNHLVMVVQQRYNYIATLGRVMHAYEWFERESSGVEPEDEKHPFTKRDTLAWIKESQPRLEYGFLRKALHHPVSEKALIPLLEAYKRYDGSDSEQSEFARAFSNCQDQFARLEDFVTPEEAQSFKDGFWEWYDKEQFVLGIDKIIMMHTSGYKGEKLSEKQIALLVNAVKREKDIDRRAILALELVKFNRDEGVLLLGDILESGVYTRYLLEAWISWRANLQSIISPSSFSVIANNYYDRMRVKCLNTFLRRLQKEPDDYMAKMLMENMILCETLHRTGSIFGNESLKTRMLLEYKYFIPERLIPNKE